FPRLAPRRDIAGENLTVVTQGFHGREVQHVEGTSHFVAAFPKTKAAFTRDEAGELFPAGLKRRAGLLEHLVALVTAEIPRTGERRLDGVLDIFGAGEAHLAGDVAVVGVANGKAGSSGDRFTSHV